ncbi:MAG: FG-GAP repeat protein [Anaerolineales bacterium]|nr:FG-GAP repeat protein [Anaerolineales bacterium]MCA9929816.1 FG-GAP repeat protein [Anaerolineales bacterium]
MLANDGAANARFGEAVALDNNTAVVGAFGAQHNGINSGAAYVFTNNEGNWGQQAKLAPNDGASGDGFGMGVAVPGTMLRDYPIMRTIRGMQHDE